MSCLSGREAQNFPAFVDESRKNTYCAIDNRFWRTLIMQLRQSLCAAALLLITAAAPLAAHHSFAAEYDGSKRVTMTGKVTKIEWMNPHAFFYLDVKDEKTGAVANWAFELN